MQVSVRRLDQGDIQASAAILRSLPDWFGIEEANAQYVRDLEALPGIVATDGDAVVGFLASRQHFLAACEIHVMAVRPELHRHGIGRVLVHHLEASLTKAGVKVLQVKTLAPSDPSPEYARTRAFYVSLRFFPMEETTAFWGKDNPALLLVKVL